MADDKQGINVDSSGLKAGESLKFDRDDKGNVTKVTKVEPSGTCWVVTAYYGDPMPPNVRQIRGKRDNLIQESAIGGSLKQVDSVYRAIGRSSFGQWWIQRVSANHSSVQRKISGCICTVLFWFSK